MIGVTKIHYMIWSTSIVILPLSFTWKNDQQKTFLLCGLHFFLWECNSSKIFFILKYFTLLICKLESSWVSSIISSSHLTSLRNISQSSFWINAFSFPLDLPFFTWCSTRPKTKKLKQTKCFANKSLGLRWNMTYVVGMDLLVKLMLTFTTFTSKNQTLSLQDKEMCEK